MSWTLIKSAKLNQTYRGHAERCTYTFTVPLAEQLGARWTAEQNLQAHVDELASQGEVVLEYKLWENKAAALSTDYQVEVTASATPLLWGIIIIAVLSILGLLVLNMVIRSVDDIAEYTPGGAALPAMAVIAVAVVVGVLVLRRRQT